jgi:hypothetical protein
MNTRIVIGIAGAAGALIALGQVDVGADSSTRTAFDDRQETVAPVGTSVGPDVTVSRVGLFSSGSGNNMTYYGQSSGISAYSMASTSCNVGDEPAEWFSGSAGNHPVIGQNIFRMSEDGTTFEQIGQSWLKHSFAALDETTCGSCATGGQVPSSYLAPDCADTYGAGLNDGQGGGPKHLINPQGQGSGGTHNSHSWSAPSGPSAIRGRLQVKHAEIISGSRYAAEIQYITHDEPLESRHNNASWREIFLTSTSISGPGDGQAGVNRGKPAIEAWAEWNEAVKVNNVDVPGEGRFLVGYLVTDNGNGTWTYEYAVQNLNSDRSARSFTVPMGSNVTTSSVGFHDVDYHSGVPYDGTDWPHTEGSSEISWSTDTFATNEMANALRWGTLYNYRFTANAAPVGGQVTLGLFKPGTPTEVSSSLLVPGDGPVEEFCEADIDGPDEAPDGNVDALDALLMISQWGDLCGGSCEADISGPTPLVPDGDVDAIDWLVLIAQWGSPGNCQ